MRYYREQAELQTVFEGPPRLTYLYTHSHLRTAKSNHPPSVTLAGLWNGFTVVVCNLVHRLEQQSSVMLFFYIDFDILDWWDGEIRFLYLYTSTDLVNVYTLALAWRSGFPLKNTNRRIPTKRPNLPPIPISFFPKRSNALQPSMPSPILWGCALPPSPNTELRQWDWVSFYWSVRGAVRRGSGRYRAGIGLSLLKISSPPPVSPTGWESVESSSSRH